VWRQLAGTPRPRASVEQAASRSSSIFFINYHRVAGIGAMHHHPSCPRAARAFMSLMACKLLVAARSIPSCFHDDTRHGLSISMCKIKTYTPNRFSEFAALFAKYTYTNVRTFLARQGARVVMMLAEVRVDNINPHLLSLLS
jgi:hypothetical protein